MMIITLMITSVLVLIVLEIIKLEKEKGKQVMSHQMYFDSDR